MFTAPQRKGGTTLTAPIIDIVMTAYNAAWSLPDTLASIAEHTVRDIRLVVADDGSTDAIPLVLALAAAADPRILVPTEPSGGIVAAARHRMVSGSGFRTG